MACRDCTNDGLMSHQAYQDETYALLVRVRADRDGVAPRRPTKIDGACVKGHEVIDAGHRPTDVIYLSDGRVLIINDGEGAYIIIPERDRQSACAVCDAPVANHDDAYCAECSRS